jgi:hypothetical protein
MPDGRVEALVPEDEPEPVPLEAVLPAPEPEPLDEPAEPMPLDAALPVLDELVPAALVPAVLVLPVDPLLVPLVPLLMPVELPLVPVVPLPVMPVELPLVPDALGVPDTFELLRTWFIAESQHWLLDVAPVVPEPVVPEPDEL